jgi:membrane associated rhomboid family serine protease
MPLVPARRAATSVARTVKSHAVTLSVPLGAAWIVLGVNTLLGGALNGFGVIPRTVEGLRGILFAPFLHGSLAHLVANTVPFVVLGWLVRTGGLRRFLFVSAAAGTPGSVHIGASGVIFGYLGYLMLSGLWARKFLNIVVSVGVTALWGGMVWGVLPGQMGISWQSHLGGFIGGVLAARSLHRRGY